MKDNSKFQDELNEIIKNKSLASNKAWTYPSVCSPGMTEIVLRTLVLGCQIPLKAQLRAMIKEARSRNIEDDQIAIMATQFWISFINSLNLPGTRLGVLPFLVEKAGSPNREQQFWQNFSFLLSQQGVELKDLTNAIDADITDSKYKRLMWIILETGFCMSTGIIGDKALHAAYIAIYDRLKELVQKNTITADYLAGYIRHGGFKLDEAFGIDGFLFSLTEPLDTNHQFVRDFFNIKGETLPTILTKAIKIVSPEDASGDTP